MTEVNHTFVHTISKAKTFYPCEVLHKLSGDEFDRMIEFGEVGSRDKAKH